MLVASQKDGVKTNCKEIEGMLHVFFDSPQFGKGMLRSRKTLHIPNENFPDGYRDIVIESMTGHVIV